MSREDPQLRIRLPIELKEKIQELANKNNRSMNAEIVYILQEWIDSQNTTEDHSNSLENLIKINSSEHILDEIKKIRQEHEQKISESISRVAKFTEENKLLIQKIANIVDRIPQTKDKK